MPHLLRQENLSERTGDTRLDCTNNGFYNPNLSPAENNLIQYMQLSLQLTLNTAVTNRTDGVTTDAVLVVNNNNSYLPLSTSEFASPGTCGGSLTEPADAPDQRYPCPQKGVLTGPSTITWNNIQFPVPGAPNNLNVLPTPDANGIPICDDFFDQIGAESCFDLTSTIRMTNVWGNSAALGGGGTVVATFGATASASFSVQTNSGTVGIILQGIVPSVAGDGAFDCTVGTRLVSINLREGFAGAFKVLGAPGLANGDNTTENGYPLLTANSSGSPPQPVGATGGGASQATRFRIEFDNVPAGVTLSMPNALDEAAPVEVCTFTPPSPGGPNPLCLQRVAGADGNGRGGTLLGGPGSSDVPVVGGEATAIYELVSGDPFLPQQITVDATFLCSPGSPQTTLLVTPSLAPTSNVGVASFSAPKPRFLGNFASPDLLVTALTGPVVGFVGGLMPISATVQNPSSAIADPHQLGFYFSTDATITTDDTPSPTTCSSAGLAPGASDSCTPSIVVPVGLLPGPYFWGAIVDDLGEVSESDETNNSRVADSGSVLVTTEAPPTADAGPDQLLQAPAGGTAEALLDGSGSSDPDDDPLTFTWTGPFPEGGGTVMGEMAMATLPAGTHTITLTVDDGQGGMDSDTVDITVNQIPVANAGPDQLLQVPGGGTAAVTLDGSGSSDPDGDSLTYTWTGPFPQGGGTVMGEMAMVTLPPGTHSITLSVDDGKGSTDTAMVDITVNQIPVASAGPDQTVNATLGTATVTLDGSGSMDPDGNPLTFTWTGTFGTVGGASPTVTLPGGVHTITLSVDDGRGGVDTDIVIVAVRALEVSTDSLSFTFGKGNGASQTLSIRATGGRVGYAIPRTASWLKTMPEGGESNGETDTIEVAVDPARSPGTYNTTMIIRGNGNIMARIPVTMIVPEGGVSAYPQLRLPDNPAIDAADFIPHGEPGHAMAGKSIIAIFGEGFVAEGEFRAETVPLPTTLGGVRVLFDGTAAPLNLVTPTLIHAQLPMGLRGPTATLLVVRDFEKAQSNPQEIEIHDYSPGIFTLAQNGAGQGIVTFANTADLAAPVGMVGKSRPATAGDHLTIYANGMGPVEPPLMDGHNSCEPDGACLPDGSNVVLHETTTKPIIRIGGVQVPEENLLFSGSSVTSVGVNELVFTVPANVPTGPSVPLTIEIGGVISRDNVTMAIE